MPLGERSLLLSHLVVVLPLQLPHLLEVLVVQPLQLLLSPTKKRKWKRRKNQMRWGYLFGCWLHVLCRVSKLNCTIIMSSILEIYAIFKIKGCLFLINFCTWKNREILLNISPKQYPDLTEKMIRLGSLSLRRVSKSHFCFRTFFPL